MTASQSFDLVVVGGGPGGYVAALRAAQLGLRTALMEREHLGGICLNWGCIPTKSLLHTADTLRRIQGAGELGLKVNAPQVDFGQVMARSRAVSTRLRHGVTQLLKRAGVVVMEGHGSFSQDKSLEVRAADGSLQKLKAKHTLLATGAHPRALPGLAFDGDRVWSYRDALAAKELPHSLAVIGAGAIGMEFASFYAALGTQVTVLEAQERVLPSSDAEVSDFVGKAFCKEDIAVRTGVRIERFRVEGDGVTLGLADGETLRAERVLVAVGLAGNVNGLGLEHTKVVVERGQVMADGWGATADPGIYAIGDLVGAPMLAHRASHQGVACVERLAGLHAGKTAPHAPIPACTYCHPQTASVGLTEAQARASGIELRVGRFPLEGNGKAVAIGETSGFIKTVFDATTGALLGAHIVGPDAPELIHGYVIASSMEATESELMEAVFPHPTLSEAMHESVLAAFGRALHI